MKTRTTIIIVVVIAVIAALLVAGFLYLPTLQNKKVLVWGTTESLNAIFPALARTYDTYIPCSAVFETLTRYKPNTTELLPSLATEWHAISPMIWEFKLRSDVKFHDGTPFNASAVEFSLERTVNDTDRPFGAIQLGRYFDYVEVVDDYTVRIHLKTPGHAGFPGMTAYCVTAIYSPTAYKNAGSDYMTKGVVGTGPYKFVSFAPAQEIVLEANRNYWDSERTPKVDKLVFKQFNDPSALKLAIEKGEIDIAHRWMYSADVSALMENPDIVTVKGNDPYVIMLPLHNNMSYTNETKIRYAIAYSIDYDAIGAIVDSERAYGIMPPSWPYAYEVQRMFERNITKAKELLSEAGYPNGLPESIQMYWCPDFGPAFQEIAVLIQGNLAEAGIPITLTSVQESTMLDYRAKGLMHMAMVRFTYTFADPDYMCYYAMRSGSAYPKGFGYGYPEIDQLMDAGAVETNTTKRIQIYREIQEIFDEKDHLVYLFRSKAYLFHRKNVHGAYIDGAIYHNIAASLTQIEKD